MSKSQLISRREFLIKTALGGTGLAFAHSMVLGKPLSIIGANNRVRVGVIGLGDRGLQHIQNFLSIPNVEIAALCDLQENALLRSLNFLNKSNHNAPVSMSDYRHLLDLPNLDVISIAIPRELRTSCGIEAIKSGKNVLLEKPFSSTIKEGQKLVRENKKYNQLVQQRDDNFFISITDICNTSRFNPIGDVKKISGFKEVFLSNSPSNHQDSRIFQPEDALDELDFSRCFLECEIPSKISTIGNLPFQVNLPSNGVFTQFEFVDQEGERKHINFEIRNSFGPKRNNFQNIFFQSIKENISQDRIHSRSEIKILGTKGETCINCDSQIGESTARTNFANFVDCVKENNRNGLINSVEEVRKSNMLIQLMELSLKYQRNIKFDPKDEIVIDDDEINNAL